MKYRNEKSKGKEASESKNFEKGEKLMKTEREYREPMKGQKGNISGRKNYKGKNWC
jgi:hypothetical protein